jgi:hypothetical protein
MKVWILVLVVLAVLWWAHQRQQKQQQTWQRPLGVVSNKGRGVRQATQFSSTGGQSPGSGVLVRQPDMNGSWGVGGGQIIGLTGPSYAYSGARQVAR